MYVTAGKRPHVLHRLSPSKVLILKAKIYIFVYLWHVITYKLLHYVHYELVMNGSIMVIYVISY